MGLFSRIFRGNNADAVSDEQSTGAHQEKRTTQQHISRAQPEPLSKERLEKIFTRRGWRYSVNDTGDIASKWEGHIVLSRCIGESNEILSIVGLHRGFLDESYENELLGFLEDFQRSKLYPKAHIQYEDQGLRIVTEHNVDLEFGATDIQIALQCQCAIGTSLELFHLAEEQFQFAMPAPENE